jgi:ABC-type uncharacterized transport system involved in gliding motility auxiliary subunit
MKRIIGALGWLGVLLVTAAVVLRFARPQTPQWSQRLALAGLAVTILYMLGYWREIGRSFQGKNVRYGSIAASSVALVLGILAAVNWIGARENKRWDLTAAKQYSLSDQTRKILADLKQPVVIRVFYASAAGQGADQYRDRLAEYSYLSKQVTTEYVDAERDPVTAQRYNITAVPTFVIEYAGRSERATSPDEQNITNALKKVIEGRAKKIYFVSGHGERDVTKSDTNGYSGIGDALKDDNFDVAPLALAQEGKVPDDATVVVVAGPKTDLLAPEVEALRAFLARGGKLALLLDPPDKGTGPDVPNLLALAHDWGITVGKDVVVDASGVGQRIGTGPSVPIGRAVSHGITENFDLMTAFPLARSVVPAEGGVNGHTAQKFIETGAQSWSETNLADLFGKGRTERNFDKGDTAGPISVAAAASAPIDTPAPASPAAAQPADAPKPETRVAVVGDSDFAANSTIGLPGNRELFLNMANWLAQQENLIAIRPRDPEDRPLTMTEDQRFMVLLFTLLAVPGLLFATAVRVWWRRRG